MSGSSHIRNGARLGLHPAPSFVGGSGTVKVGHVTSTSFTFTVASHGYFDAPGATILFSIYEKSGNDYLQQTANAPNTNGLEGILAPIIANVDWQKQASNLSNAVGGDYSSAAVNSMDNAG